MILNLFPDRWQQIQETFDGSVVDRISQYQVYLKCPEQKQLRQILELRTQGTGINLSSLFTEKDLKDILSQPSIRTVINRASDYYQFKFHQVPLPPIQKSISASLLKRSPGLEDRVANIEAALEKITQLLKPYLDGSLKLMNLGTQSEGDLDLDLDLDVDDLDLLPSAPKPPGNPPVSAVSSTATQATSSSATKAAQKPVPTPPLDNLPPYNNDVGSITTAKPKVPVLSLREVSRNRLKEYLAQERKSLDQDYDRPKVIDSVDDIGKLKRIVNSFRSIVSIKVDQLSIGRKRVPEHLALKIDDKSSVIGFLHEGGNSFTSRIRNFNQLMNNYPKMNFYLIRDRREPKIRAKGGLSEIEKLEYAKNGEFIQMDRQNRINFELIDSVIVAIQERDLEIDLSLAMELLLEELKDYWLIKLFQAGSY